jgi:hypothetical protein
MCRYFFQVLDVENVGRLSAAVLSMWTAHVHAVAFHRMAAVGAYDPEDVKDEIFDMVKPKEAGYVALPELAASGMSDAICGILVDGQCHVDYEQREELQAQQAPLNVLPPVEPPPCWADDAAAPAQRA